MTTTPHTIRLRDPWQTQVVDHGHVRCTRHFGRPTGLGPGDRVELVVAAFNSLGAVNLNGQVLEATEARSPIWRADVTSLLLPRNILSITFDLGDDRTAPPDSDAPKHPARPGAPSNSAGSGTTPHGRVAPDVCLEIHVATA